MRKLKIILNSNIFLIILSILTIFTIIHKINNISSKYNIDTKEIIGFVTNIKKDEEKTILTIKDKENILAYYYNETDINLGDKVKIIGTLNKLSSNTNFNLFNYKNYMLSKNTHFNMNVDNIILIEKNKNIFYKMKTYLINRIKNIKKHEYLNTFILGDSSYIDDTLLESYRINGISHLFSVSGMHITLLSSITLAILNKIKKKYINYLFVILFLLFYMFLTNFTPSVIRATCLFIFLSLNKVLKLNLTTSKILLIILMFNLIINPYNIYNVGFKFSYIISLYLVAFSKIISRYKNYIVRTLVTSSISFLSSIPILINNYFSINIMTTLNNVMFVPLISIIIFPFSLIVLLIPKLDFIYELMINILEKLSLFVTNFKIEIIFSKVNIFIIILYYLIITLVLYKIYKRKYKYIFLIIIVLFIHTNINYIKNNPYITFIDVGQGDSAFIHLPYNKGNILIDTGGKYNYDTSKDIISYLKSEGIKNIDFLLISHGDYDHMGEAINLVNNFKVEKVIFNCGPYNDLEKDLIKVLDKEKIKYYSCIKELNIDKKKLYFLQTKEYDNENDNSNVIYTELDGYRFMFMGDASSTTEKEILNKYNLLDIDVLKVGHHGSRTSSSKEFINEINPNYSVISVGKNNRYGHPNKEVLDNLENSKIYRTDQDGSIMFKIKNNKLKIETCSP
ncbi:MAG: DNA internalization-related competence protein ComEC/Rec2 [Firmicutes bacterium]|nr:DNA internalization-related competence protein ComEC/Rec2 [Bacillota bacterium]